MESEYNELKGLIKLLVSISKEEIKKISKVIDDVIKYEITDENTISHVFDNILSLVFVDQDGEDDINKLYYKLLNYTKKFNKSLSDDYENIFIEQYSDTIGSDNDGLDDLDTFNEHKEGRQKSLNDS